ncbi:hypothetical protein SAMN05444273_103267 [Litoreibacter ascidiaceicola]|uniref:Uncharacterized protein n=2 Tax=Litoreibacter ascidiaceicola TaxID=1486859 RepID=A0A1M4XQS5_9RHOB|nr:hypothetical protein SAMN05444273_103267 [Litoreibacter ascidiaceicola]
MLMDKMTEMVAHMIGIFHTTMEDERMREAYDKFKALKAADPDNDPLEAMGIKFKAKHVLEGFTPSLRYSDEAHSAPADDINTPFYSSATIATAKLHSIAPTPSETSSIVTVAMGIGRPLLKLEPPGSVVVITAQSAYLSDNDITMLGSGDTLFTDTAEFLDQLMQYQTIATAIASPVTAEMITPGENAARDAIKLHEKVSTAEATMMSGVLATMQHNTDAIGMRINGEEVEEIPTLNDLWPAFKSANADDAQDASGEDGEPLADQAATELELKDPFQGLANSKNDNGPPEIEDGHAVVAGANTLVNEVLINTAWLDAPVISVMGDVVNLNVVSQVNVLVDHDIGVFDDLKTSTSMNAAHVAATATTPEPEAGEEADDTADLGLPSNWAVTKIEGDLIAVNQVSQYSFVTDNDCAEITFNSANTYIGLGDNSVINLTDLSELGFGFDLIMIGGSMISVNWISQINVMIDNDTVTYSGDTPAGFSGSDNLLFNGAVINSIGVDSYGEMQANFAAASDSLANGGLTIDESVAHDSVFEGTEILRVLYIEGDLTTINWIEQTNVLGDSDQVHLAMENFEAATGASVTVTAGSNSTINVATINEYGTDSAIAVNGDVYDDALLYQAELIDTDADPLGVDMPALATEAVAFLADDMMSPDMTPADAAIVATASESTASSDVMQSMLA